MKVTGDIIAVAGAGLSGAVLARHMAENSDMRVVIFDGRPHVGGNCHTETDTRTGIMVHKYGPHIFHTDSGRVWEFLTRFAEFRPYVHSVLARTPRGDFPLPINLLTINAFFGKDLDPAGAKALVGSLAVKPPHEPGNFEEMALATIGRDLYENFYYGYTKKHWGVEPRELPPQIFSRLPIRFDQDTSYFRCRYQGIPAEGYTAMIERILDHPQIEVLLNEKLEPGARGGYRHLFWTGTLDGFFNHRFGRLSYRTSYWVDDYARGDWQKTAQVNYTALDVPHTRVIEPKFFTPWEEFGDTVYQREFSKATGPGDNPCYPVRAVKDMEVLSKYRELALHTEGVSFLGRLGTYSYIDMDQAVDRALALSEAALPALLGKGSEVPRFLESAPALT